MDTPTRKRDDSEKSKVWCVRNEQGGRFGPVDFATLKSWACDGRIGPTNEVSDDGAEWRLAASLSGLEMDCVAEVMPGNFYGPIHREAMLGLIRDGAIAAEAVLFRRSALGEGQAPEAQGLRDEHARLLEDEQARRSATGLEGQVRLAEQRAAASEKELNLLRLEQASQAEQARRSMARLEERVREAEQRAAAHDTELCVLRRQGEAVAEQAREAEQRAAASEEKLCALRQQSETQLEQAHDALRREQARGDELDRRRSEAEAEQAETARQLDSLHAAHQAQAAAWGAERRALEFERQTLLSEVARAQAETASRAQRVAQLEEAVAEAGRAMARQRDELARQVSTLRDEVSSARADFAEQHRILQQAQSQVAALTDALDSAKHGLDGDQLHLATLSKELTESRREADRLRAALRQKAAGAETPPATATVEVLETEPLDKVPCPKVRPRRQHATLDAEVLPPEEPSSEAKPPPMNTSARARTGISLADLEQQARRELERLGAHGPAFFAKKR